MCPWLSSARSSRHDAARALRACTSTALPSALERKTEDAAPRERTLTCFLAELIALATRSAVSWQRDLCLLSGKHVAASGIPKPGREAGRLEQDLIAVADASHPSRSIQQPSASTLGNLSVTWTLDRLIEQASALSCLPETTTCSEASGGRRTPLPTHARLELRTTVALDLA